jgi:hypothetical protein
MDTRRGGAMAGEPQIPTSCPELRVTRKSSLYRVGAHLDRNKPDVDVAEVAVPVGARLRTEAARQELGKHQRAQSPPAREVGTRNTATVCSFDSRKPRTRQWKPDDARRLQTRGCSLDGEGIPTLAARRDLG